MANFDLTTHKPKERDTITFGNDEKKITIDITFIPSLLGYRVRTMLVKDPKTDTYTPETLASIIAMFTEDVDAAWIVENCEYIVLDRIAAMIYTRAFARLPEKN